MCLNKNLKKGDFNMSKKILFSIILFSIVFLFNCNSIKAVSIDPDCQIKRSQNYYIDKSGVYVGEFPQYKIFIPYFFIPKNPNEPITADYVPGEEDTFITPEYSKANNVKWYVHEIYGSAEVDDDGYVTITSFKNDPNLVNDKTSYGCSINVRCELTNDNGETMKSYWVKIIIKFYYYPESSNSQTTNSTTNDSIVTNPNLAKPINCDTVSQPTNDSNSVLLSTTETIEPPVLSLSLKKLTKNKVKLTWKSKSGPSLKKRNDLSGYQIKYWWKKSKKTSKKYTKKIKKYSKITAIFKKLKKNRKYYFKVRAYKMIPFYTNYGKWSKTKTVKIKK